MTHKSQCQSIQNHLEKGGVITSMSAFTLFGCTSLHRRLSDLRSRGVVIEDKVVTNGSARFKMYWVE